MKILFYKLNACKRLEQSKQVAGSIVTNEYVEWLENKLITFIKIL